MKRTCLGLWYGARLFVQLAAACYLTISFTYFNLQAESRDLTALSLEELMNVRRHLICERATLDLRTSLGTPKYIRTFR